MRRIRSIAEEEFTAAQGLGAEGRGRVHGIFRAPGSRPPTRCTNFCGVDSFSPRPSTRRCCAIAPQDRALPEFGWMWLPMSTVPLPMRFTQADFSPQRAASGKVSWTRECAKRQIGADRCHKSAFVGQWTIRQPADKAPPQPPGWNDPISSWVRFEERTSAPGPHPSRSSWCRRVP
jgi:hypothetical protein